MADADLDMLQSLVDKSLLRHSDERYWMLETVREYAGEQLEESGGAEELWRRHADYFVTVAEALPVDVPVSGAWLDRMEMEHDNLRAALDSLGDEGDTQLALRLSGASWRLWGVRGPHTEGLRRLDLALSRDDQPTLARAYALTGAVALAVDTRDYEGARRRAEEALALYDDLEHPWGVARATFQLGYVANEAGDFGTARPFLEESLQRFEELDAEHDVLFSLYNLSWACDELGDSERGRDLAEEFVRRARASGNARQVAFGLDLIEFHAREEGRFDDALEAAVEGLRLRRDEGAVQNQLDVLSRLARTHADVDRTETATSLLSASLHLHEELGMQVPLYQEQRNKVTLALTRAALAEPAFAEAWEQGRALTLDEAVALALTASARPSE